MRIVIPNFPATDSFVDNVSHTLRNMGHEVLTPAVPLTGQRGALMRLWQDNLGKLFPERWTAAEKWVVSAVGKTTCDMVLCLTQSLRPEVLEILRGSVRHLVAWWGDCPANMRGHGLLATAWDRIYLKDAAAVAKFRTAGLDAELMHEAMNPDWHRRRSSGVSDEVVVAGNYYGYRQFLSVRLMERGVEMALYGPPPPRWSDRRIVAAHRGRYIVRDEKSEIFGAALACLNSTALAEGDSLNCRAFEIAGAGGLQLIEDKPSVATCFEPGREVVVFKSIDDIVEATARARADRDWAHGIREAGHARALAEHTYHHRLTRLLRSL